jgi:hypothetical protein
VDVSRDLDSAIDLVQGVDTTNMDTPVLAALLGAVGHLILAVQDIEQHVGADSPQAVHDNNALMRGHVAEMVREWWVSRVDGRAPEPTATALWTRALEDDVFGTDTGSSSGVTDTHVRPDTDTDTDTVSMSTPGAGIVPEPMDVGGEMVMPLTVLFTPDEWGRVVDAANDMGMAPYKYVHWAAMFHPYGS